MAKEVYHSRVYTDRPAYADLDAPEKFAAIRKCSQNELDLYYSKLCREKEEKRNV